MHASYYIPGEVLWCIVAHLSEDNDRTNRMLSHVVRLLLEEQQIKKPYKRSPPLCTAEERLKRAVLEETRDWYAKNWPAPNHWSSCYESFGCGLSVG